MRHDLRRWVVCFSTYATYWIKQAIQLAVMNTATTIRVPAHVFRLLIRWKRTEQALGLINGRPPAFEEVASKMGLTEQQKILVIRARHARDLRLESVLSAGGHAWSSTSTRAGHELPADPIEADEERTCLQQSLRQLDSRELAVLVLRYGLGDEQPLKLREIGRRLGLSREWARKLADQALRKLVQGSAPSRDRVPEDGRKQADSPRPKGVSPRRAKRPRPTVGLEPVIEPASSQDHLERYAPEVADGGQDGTELALCG
jgi:RNA polymerase primary sigma factor